MSAARRISRKLVDSVMAHGGRIDIRSATRAQTGIRSDGERYGRRVRQDMLTEREERVLARQYGAAADGGAQRRGNVIIGASVRCAAAATSVSTGHPSCRAGTVPRACLEWGRRGIRVNASAPADTHGLRAALCETTASARPAKQLLRCADSAPEGSRRRCVVLASEAAVHDRTVVVADGGVTIVGERG